jgi:hypothetical protein
MLGGWCVRWPGGTRHADGGAVGDLLRAPRPHPPRKAAHRVLLRDHRLPLALPLGQCLTFGLGGALG